MGTFVQVIDQGLLLLLPKRLVPSRNSTNTTATSSAALAVMTILAGATKLAPLAGLVMLTVGRPLIETFTGADTLDAPRLSVAMAVSTCAPARALVQVNTYGLFVTVPSLLV